MDPAYPLSVTLFWLVYVPLLLGAVALFAWALYRYASSRRQAGDEPAGEVLRPGRCTVPELVALRAQFIVAPRLARQEAKAMLAGRPGVAASEVLPDDFDLLLVLLSRTATPMSTRSR